MALEDPLIFERDKTLRLAHLTLNRPDKFNCVSIGLLDALEQALDEIEDDRNVRAVIINGAGKHFCTGADLVEARAAKSSSEAQRAFLSHGHRVLTKLEQLATPTIAAVHGLALAGGMEIALACDIVFMAESARMGDQHGQFGLIPGWGGSQRLPRLVGRRRSLELMFSARWLSAAEAKSWGLANYIVADDLLLQEAKAYGAALGRCNPDGLSNMKRLVLGSENCDLETGLKMEIDVSVEHSMSNNVAEGLAAFHEKREPNFT